MTVEQLIRSLTHIAAEHVNFDMPVMVRVYRDGAMEPEDVEEVTYIYGKGILLE